MPTTSTYATFTDPQMAEKAAGALLDHGIRSEHISILFPEGYGENRPNTAEESAEAEGIAKTGITTTTAADAASGSAKGATVGLAAGTLAALAAIFIPGVGLVVGGGALAMALAGTAATTAAGAVAGGLTGYLKDQDVPPESIQHYTTVLREGGVIMVVSPTDEGIDTSEIVSVLSKYGGVCSAFGAAVVATEPSVIISPDVRVM